LQPNTLSNQPALRAAYPASVALLAAATNAALIVADFRARRVLDDCDMPALAAAQRGLPAEPWTETRAIACDLAINRLKNSGEYDARRQGARA